MPRVPIGSRETWTLGLLSCGTPRPGLRAPPSDYRARAGEPHGSPPTVRLYLGSQNAMRKREGRQERGFPTRFGSKLRMAQSPGCSLSRCALPVPLPRSSRGTPHLLLSCLAVPSTWAQAIFSSSSSSSLSRAQPRVRLVRGSI